MSDNQSEQIEIIRTFPSRLRETLRDMSEEQLDTQYREGGWTVRQVVHHLADSHVNAYIRMKLIATEEYPTLREYDQDAWAECEDAKQMPIDTSLRLLEALHTRWVQFMKSLGHAEWTMAGMHPESGNLVMRDLLDIYARHGENHLEQIQSVKK